MSMLEFENVEVFYGKIQALRGMSIRVEEGEIVSLLGNNGAGKTTTLSTASAIVKAHSGRISFAGSDITRAKPWEVVAGGLIHVPEGRRIFSTLTVAENLQLGGYLVKDRGAVAKRMKEVYEMLPLLAERRSQQGGTLSGGEQQMLAIGRALIAGPRMLMLDEPSMGLAPLIVAQVMEVIKDVNANGTTVLLVEQNARAALKITSRGYVIEGGATTMTGTGPELLADSRIVEAYLGA
ncbi:branched-chain amino acid transport system ATP-binding protein [Arthrobacter stackebrandtii]|uniref:Branched-chain amino acid transport system ATP-binding protein n=1 Tax=Arthrobacter stackebrandtii TaxID=272161 RepID=A0ABS4YVJ2_9MICC|nr:ABC transporter ATP-binding protein [Arthrobacter stackebrandtii]MBP2412818.1 branched-chain amino acid transport system ATP-binding protein [Arthrobacter stackebrandtii]PYH01359.1 ABC transporter ATP-binding protein [Arthrobacter stackebrandtii]